MSQPAFDFGDDELDVDAEPRQGGAEAGEPRRAAFVGRDRPPALAVEAVGEAQPRVLDISVPHPYQAWMVGYGGMIRAYSDPNGELEVSELFLPVAIRNER